MKRLLFAVLVFFSLLLVFRANVNAQTSPALSAVAQNIVVNDSSAGSGDILSVTTDGLKRASKAYDVLIFGVIVDAPVISVEPKTDKTKPVVVSGNAKVKVSNSNGNIAIGDFITSSTNAGVGQKATVPGYVLGKALEKYDGGSANLISVSLEKGYAQIGSTGGGGFFQSFVSDSGRLRSSLASLVAAIAILGGVIAFVRVVNSGVVAIGRNPLARSTIIRGMFISGTVVVLIMAVGLGVAVAIIILGK